MVNTFITKNNYRKSFTLIELLVVLALVAILSVVVVMTLNPAELIKQARDSNRLSDLSTINTALNLFSADVTSGFMGTSTIVYVSIPDNASSTCGSLGLPTLPTGYTYNCVSAANLRNTDGTGWIPVNFQRISSNSPISQLPIDPQNTTSTKYYTYVTGGSWKVMATPESQKYLATAGTDGGSNIGQFEVGNNMSLAPFTDGLVGWWKFDEASGTTAADSSGWGNTGTASGTAVIAGKVGNARNFSGADIVMAYLSEQTMADNITFGGIYKFNSVSSMNDMLTMSGYLAGYDYLFRSKMSYGQINVDINDGTALEGPVTGSTAATSSIWQNIFFVYSKNNYFKIYVDSIEVASTQSNISKSFAYQYIDIGGYHPAWGQDAYRMVGGIDDVRIYNRALSATEVLALYNATK